MSDQSKPREFWVRIGYSTPTRDFEDIIFDQIPGNGFKGEIVHVIEATPKTLAAEEMFAKLEQMVREIKACEGTCPIDTFREAEALVKKARGEPVK